MQAVNLKADYRTNPIGIQTAAPHLSWECSGGKRQSAFRIICRNPFRKVVWDSGKRYLGIPFTAYLGPPLKSRERIYWQVRLWNEDDLPGRWSEESVFELGLLFWTDWKAQWISGNYLPEKNLRYPVDMLKKCFTSSGTVRRARLYAAACGSFRIRLNGVCVEENSILHGVTDTAKRVFCRTYDVTGLIGTSADGRAENELIVELGDGWIRHGRTGGRIPAAVERKCILQLETEYTDGRCERVVSNELWKWGNDGPFRESSVYGGETVEAYREPTFPGHARITSHSAVPTASFGQLFEEEAPVIPVVTTAPNGMRLLDFGRVITGFLSITMDANDRQYLSARFSTELGEDGNLPEETPKNKARSVLSRLIRPGRPGKAGATDGALEEGNPAGKTRPLSLPAVLRETEDKKDAVPQHLAYYCREGRNTYRSAFSIYTFRYIEVDTQLPVTPDQFRAIPLGVRLGKNGAAYRKALQAGRRNPLLIRARRLPAFSLGFGGKDFGNAGMLSGFVKEMAASTDCVCLLRYFLALFADGQRKDGSFPAAVPGPGYPAVFPGSAGEDCSGAPIRMLWYLWAASGDYALLAEYYGKAASAAGRMLQRCGKSGLFSRSPKVSAQARKYITSPPPGSNETVPEATLETAELFSVMAKLAGAAGEREDAVLFREASLGCLQAYRELTEERS